LRSERVDHAAKFDDAAVAGSLYDTAMMHRERRVDQVAAQRPAPRRDAILVRRGRAG
jgi:hypothetical protein